MSADEPDVSVIVVAYGAEPSLLETLRSVRESRGVALELIVVDNGYTGPDQPALAELCDEWLNSGGNVGFAPAVNFAAQRCRGTFLALVNSDAVVDADALAELMACAADPSVGPVQGQVLLHDEPETINTVGNPVHYSMMSWSGGWGEPAGDYPQPVDLPVASGCLLMIRARLFAELGGFYGELFAYGEDLDLSLRAWQAGYRARYCPTALAWHRYEFHRTGQKLFFLERGRLVSLLTLFEGRTLLRLGLGIILVEGGVWFAALRDGWWRQKWGADAWLISNRKELARRRRWVQARRRVPDYELMRLFSARITPSPRSGESVPRVLNDILALLGRIGGVPVTSGPGGSESPVVQSWLGSAPVSGGGRVPEPGAPGDRRRWRARRSRQRRM